MSARLIVAALWMDAENATELVSDALQGMKIDGTKAAAVSFNPEHPQMARLAQTMRQLDLAEVVDRP